MGKDKSEPPRRGRPPLHRQRVHLTLSQEASEMCDELQRSEGMSRSNVVEQAIRMYYRRWCNDCGRLLRRATKPAPSASPKRRITSAQQAALSAVNKKRKRRSGK